MKHDAIALDDPSSIDTFSKCMKVVLESRGKMAQVEKDLVAEKHLEEQYQADRDVKRMFSYKQLFDLHRIMNNSSEVHDRTTQNESDIKKIYEDLVNVKNMIKNLRQYTDDQIKDFRDQMSEEKQA